MNANEDIRRAIIRDVCELRRKGYQTVRIVRHIGNLRRVYMRKGKSAVRVDIYGIRSIPFRQLRMMQKEVL